MNNPTDPNDESLRPHSYDGIQEYDKRLPNWWLWTLYLTIVFSVLYWAYYHAYGIGATPSADLARKRAENAAIAARTSGVISDESIWKASVDPSVVSAGKATFDTFCVACHKPDLTGLIGPNLVDNQWIHGGTPMELVKFVIEGNLAKGMPAWGPQLGQQKISEVVAYIMSHHKPGEAIVKVDGWVPPAGIAPLPAAPVTPPSP